MSFRGKGRFGASGGGGDDAPLKREGSGGGPPGDQHRRFDRKRAYEPQPYESRSGSDFKKPFHLGNETEVDIITNAFPIQTDPKRFGALHIFKIAFEGPRQLDIWDEGIKQRLITHKSIWPLLPPTRCVDYRDKEGARLFVLASPNGPTGSEMLRDVQNTEISLRTGRRPADGTDGGSSEIPVKEEVWTLSFKEESKSPLRTAIDNPSAWLQFLTIVSEIALTSGGFSSVSNNRRIAQLDQQDRWLKLRSIDGALVPGFSKAFTFTENGAYWVFAPRYTVLLDMNMDRYLGDLLREDQRLYEDRSELAKVLRRRRLFVVTAYMRSNVYQALAAPADVKATDLIKIFDKSTNGGSDRKANENDAVPPYREISHIEYLREKYGGQCSALYERGLESAQMIACTLVGRRKAAVKCSRTVYIPAPLLKLVDVNMTDFHRNIREEITRHSQRTASDAFSEIHKLISDLSQPAIQETFQAFGLCLDQSASKIKGQNNLRRTVIISLSPPAGTTGGSGSGSPSRGSPGGVKDIYLDDSGNFMKDFISARTHAVKPKIGTQYMVVVRRDHGRVPSSLVERFLSDLAGETRRLGWDISINPTNSWVESFDTEEDLAAVVPRIMKDISAGAVAKPLVLFGLIPERDDYNYGAVKRFAFRLGVPSQVVTAKLLQRLGTKAFWKMLASLNAKIAAAAPPGEPLRQQPSPWRLRDDPLGVRPNTVAIGIATYCQSANRRGGGMTGWGIVATTNNDCTGVVQDFGQTASADRTGMLGDLRSHLRGVLRRLRYQHRRKLENLIIYRRGVTDSAFERLKLVEVPQIEAALADVIGAQTWDPNRRILTLTYPPAFTEKGVYNVELNCRRARTDDSTDLSSLVVIQKSVEAIYATDPDTGGSKVRLEVPITPEEGTPSLHTPPRITLPDGQKKFSMHKTPAFAYIVANHCHSANLLFFKQPTGGGDRGLGGDRRSAYVTPCGTIVDKHFRGLDLTGKTRDEFYIVPGTGAIGFSAPTHYSVITNTLEMSMRELEEISLRLCFLYFNQQGSIKCPFLVRIAETAAEQAQKIYANIDTILETDRKSATTHKIPINPAGLKDTPIFL